MTAYSVRRKLRFAHCDPAGIAYYPRYLELCDGVVEDWCEAVLEVPRKALHLDLKLGLPTVTMSAEFVGPGRLGDWIDFELRVTAIGNSSIDFVIGAATGGEPLFSTRYRQVLMDLETQRSVPWPDDWRRRISESMISRASLPS